MNRVARPVARVASDYFAGGQWRLNIAADGECFAMPVLLRCLALLASLAVLAGCSQPASRSRPSVYRGGQYYDDAVHADTARTGTPSGPH